MKVIFCILLALVTFKIYASPQECMQKLTNNYQQDSLNEVLNIEELDDRYQRDFGSDHLAYAINMIRALLEEKKCNPDPGVDINFSRTSTGVRAFSKCRYLIPNEALSLTCSVESSLGKFYVTWDDFDRCYIVFSRWD